MQNYVADRVGCGSLHPHDGEWPPDIRTNWVIHQFHHLEPSKQCPLCTTVIPEVICLPQPSEHSQ